VQHTFINHDTDLVDVTLQVTKTTTAVSSKAGQHTGSQTRMKPQTTKTNEVVETTTNHPWLTADHGWMPAGFLHLGEPVQQLNGSTATVVDIQPRAGAASMWDLSVSSVHTFSVDYGEYVVHNDGMCNWGSDNPELSDHILNNHGQGERLHLLDQIARGGRGSLDAANRYASKSFFEMGDEDALATVRRAWTNRVKAGAQILTAPNKTSRRVVD
jgi:hypothetical protein